MGRDPQHPALLRAPPGARRPAWGGWPRSSSAAERTTQQCPIASGELSASGGRREGCRVPRCCRKEKAAWLPAVLRRWFFPVPAPPVAARFSAVCRQRSGVRAAWHPLPAQHVAVGLSPAGPSCAPRRPSTTPSSPRACGLWETSATPTRQSAGQHSTAAAPLFPFASGSGRSAASQGFRSRLLFVLAFFFPPFFKSAILEGSVQAGRTGRDVGRPQLRSGPGWMDGAGFTSEPGDSRGGARWDAGSGGEEGWITARRARSGRSRSAPRACRQRSRGGARRDPNRAGESLRAGRFRAQRVPLPSAPRCGGGRAAVGVGAGCCPPVRTALLRRAPRFLPRAFPRFLCRSARRDGTRKFRSDSVRAAERHNGLPGDCGAPELGMSRTRL